MNRMAHELLTQDGETHAALWVEDGKLHMRPILVPAGAVVHQVMARGDGEKGGFLTLGVEARRALGLTGGEDLLGVWNDVDGTMVFEIAKSEEVAA